MKKCNECKPELEENEESTSFSFTLLKELSEARKSESKRCFKIIIALIIVNGVLVLALASSNAYWINFIDGYTFESTEIQVESQTGTAIYQNSLEGDNINGQNNSNDKKNDTKR